MTYRDFHVYVTKAQINGSLVRVHGRTGRHGSGECRCVGTRCAVRRTVRIDGTIYTWGNVVTVPECWAVNMEQEGDLRILPM